MSDPTDSGAPADTSGAAAPKKRGGLSTMLLADLKAMAGGLGVPGAGSMKKAQLVAAIREAQSGGGSGGSGGGTDAPAAGEAAADTAPRRARGGDQAGQGGPSEQPDQAGQSGPSGRSGQEADRGEQADRQRQRDQQREQQGRRDQQRKREEQAEQRDQQPSRQDQPKQDQGKQDQGKQDQGKQDQGKQDQAKQDQQARRDQREEQQDDDEGGSRRNRRRRGRDRERPVERTATRSAGRGEPDTTILEDDVLVPAAGILDVLENYAFVRTSGYLPGPDDVYVSLSIVRKHGLRRGDAVVGQVRQPREGERREKFNPMVRIDSVNGAEPDAAGKRPDFSSLTPVHPTERLRLETSAGDLVGRVVDLVAPVGKGQRGMVVSPARAGRTTLLHSIAASVTANNPECHLMVVLVDERPEEVTDFERSVKGEVIASTFDRPAVDHTTLAELAVERAKRLVEVGHDVVVLLDGLTRLTRAYNVATPPSGRILPGGVDAAALHPPKRLFGAARNVENGGSLTILATAVVESGSTTDEVIFEELEGTSNSELRLRRDLAERQVFPAIDPVRSRTRHEDQLLGEQEAGVVAALRQDLAGVDEAQALGTLLDRVRRTQSNVELLVQVQRSGAAGSPTAATGGR